MKAYFSRLRPYIFFFLITHTLLRLSLMVRAVAEAVISIPEFIQIMMRGLWFDVVTTGFVVLPVSFVLLLVRKSFWERRAGYVTELALRLFVFFAIVFGFVAEHIFWTEFSTRFNFIAVDYLIYTQEVVGNIRESYPVGPIISGLLALSAALVYFTRRKPASLALPPIAQRARSFACHVLVCCTLYSASNVGQAQFDNNVEASELASNGVYNLFYAFWHNEISYDRFYAQRSRDEVMARARTLLAQKDEPFENDTDLTRIIKASGAEKHKNVMLVVMESLSAEYMGTFGNKQNLTPNLDRLAKEGLLFSQLYATGTRTVRGLEAITLSVPPTPGQSIVRRPGNDNLFSLGFVFKDRGYDTKFIYGGYGYFDNMSAFFSTNGFDVVDRTSMTKPEINFANVWGVADDDMFARALKEADASYAAGKPFMHLIMTTSNHRPYTYPEGRIDIPSKSGRAGGVKYADYSVGKLVEWAQKKPWFKDTVFVFLADHTAGAGGKAELDPKKYHIPMIFYAPELIGKGRYDKIASQIDFAPTLLGWLNFSYRSKFYGEDLMQKHDNAQRAFISNYQKVALAKNGKITVLAPKRKIEQFGWPQEDPLAKEDPELISDAIGYYQSASWWHETQKRINTKVQ